MSATGDDHDAFFCVLEEELYYSAAAPGIMHIKNLTGNDQYIPIFPLQ